MEWTPFATSQEQAAVTSGVVRLILDHLALLNHGTDLRRADHAVGPAHLANRMGKEEDLPPRRLPDTFEDADRIGHMETSR